MKPDPTFLGTVEDVRGASLSVALHQDTVSGLLFIEGKGYRIGQVGSFVRIPLGLTDLFGIVSQVGAGAVPERIAEVEPFGRRWMTIQLVGEGTRGGRFDRGISQYPTVSDKVHLVTESDLAAVYGSLDDPASISVGQVASAESIPALVDVNKLLSRHCAIVGNTGSGKSTTVAGLLSSLSDPELFPSSRIIVFDLHGEYRTALGNRAKVFRINADPARGEIPLKVPYWAMNSDELLPLTFGVIPDTDRGAVLEEIRAMKRESLAATARSGVTNSSLTADSPVPFSIHRLWFELYSELNATHTAQQAAQTAGTRAYAVDGNNNPLIGDAMTVEAPQFMPIQQGVVFLSALRMNIRRHLDALGNRLRDPRYHFLFRPGSWTPNANHTCPADLDSLLKDWLGGPQPVTILDLSGVPASVLTNIIGVVVRIIFDALFWGRHLSEGGRERPLLLVLEEAHRYLSRDSAGPGTESLRRVAKEGRKYGIGAMLVSQRPSEIDPTVFSQCGTIFAMRLANSIDRGYVTSSVTEHLQGLLDMLPSLRTGEAVIVGEAVKLPLRAMITAPPEGQRPESVDPAVFEENGPGGWNRARTPEDYSDMIEVWRARNPRSPKLQNLDEAD
jgi:hypothetical protein